MKDAIAIKWSESTEWVDLDFSRLTKHPNIGSTNEVWEDETFVTYKTSSRVISADAAGTVKIEISYKRNWNADAPKGALFGKATITLKRPYDRGTAIWHDDDESWHNGPGRWVRLKGELKKPIDKVTKTIQVIERRQAEFRKLLIGRYRSCAITGESTVSALEAAHIIPSKDGGAETLANGILLRADLHRMYDAGQLRIGLNGQISFGNSNRISAQYRRLAGKMIPRPVLLTVREALRERK